MNWPCWFEHFDLHEVGKLPDECLDSLLEPRKVALDLRAQQGLHAAVGELRFQFVDGSGWIAEETGQRRSHAGLRPCAFEQNAVEDFDLIEMVALGLKELPPLVDGRFHDGIVIAGERNLWPVRFEEILIDMEARAEGFERSFQPLDRIFLLAMSRGSRSPRRERAAPCPGRRSWSETSSRSRSRRD